MQDIKNEEYVTCPRCEKEVYKDAITCPFCNFGIMAWLEGEINENGEPVKRAAPKRCCPLASLHLRTLCLKVSRSRFHNGAWLLPAF